MQKTRTQTGGGIKLMKRLCLIAVLLLAGCPMPVPVAPQPPAPVVVTAECLDIITIDDFALRSGALGQFLGDMDYWSKLRTNCHQFWHVDANQAADYQAQITEAGGLPCVIFADAKTQKKIASVKLPNADTKELDETMMDALIKKYTTPK